MINVVLQTVVAFAATVTFSLIFNIPRKELAFCGLAGAVGFFVCKLTLLYLPGSLVTASFFASLAVTLISRVLSYQRKMPVSVYLAGGVIALVPGSGIYYTIYELIINNESQSALTTGVETAKVFGVIAIGIICVLSLPGVLFDYTKYFKG